MLFRPAVQEHLFFLSYLFGVLFFSRHTQHRTQQLQKINAKRYTACLQLALVIIFLFTSYSLYSIVYVSNCTPAS